MAPLNAAPQQLSVLLFQAESDSETVFVNGPFVIVKPSAQTFPSKRFQISRRERHFEIAEFDRQFGQAERRPQIIRAPFILLQPSAGGSISIGRSKEKIRRYFGAIHLSSPDGKKLVCRNQVSRRDYVTCVVGSESPPKFPIEALKALSVLIQTTTLRYKPDDVLNDTTEKQAYMGADFARPEVLAAVQQTWGQKLLCGDQLVPIYFHSTCAGATSSSELFTGRKPTLSCDRTVECKHCSESPFFKMMSKTIPQREFDKKISTTIPKVDATDTAGRPQHVNYANGKSETGYQLWLRIGQQLGWDKAPGTRFAISKTSSGDYQIKSNGAGHGVGLCQWGAKGLADQKWKHGKILQYYFPGSRIAQEG